jgi:branched-chain amino acid transport system ATP-binding protein
MSILKSIDLTKCFGGLTALDNCNMEVAKGSIHGLIGPNGAGKTTFFNTISGVLAPSRGKIFFEESPIQGLAPHVVHKFGIARTFQLVSIFREMTVLENVLIGMHTRTRTGVFGALCRTAAVRLEEAQALSIAHDTLRLILPSLKETRALFPAKYLSHGEQRLLEIARALASNPKLLLLDEPGAGLNPSEKNRLKDLIVQIRDMGITVVFVEHDMPLAMALADRLTVLDHGAIIAEGNPKEIQSNPCVLEAYLGNPK